MLTSIRRGFFEALRNSTSQFTHRLRDTLREFEDPNSKDYQNKEKLKEAAQAYLDLDMFIIEMKPLDKTLQLRIDHFYV